MREKSADSAALDFQLPETDEGFESLDRLEEKVAQAISQIKSLRAENAELREETADLQRRIADQNVQLKELRGKFARLENDRVNVKARVQRLIEEVDAIAAAGSED